MYDVIMQDGYKTSLAADSENEVVKIITRWFKCNRKEIKFIKRR